MMQAIRQRLTGPDQASPQRLCPGPGRQGCARVSPMESPEIEFLGIEADSLPASILEKSRMSLITARRCIARNG